MWLDFIKRVVAKVDLQLELPDENLYVTVHFPDIPLPASLFKSFWYYFGLTRDAFAPLKAQGSIDITPLLNPQLVGTQELSW
jgi:hypothetical protein